jgi:hypothetical protein
MYCFMAVAAPRDNVALRALAFAPLFRGLPEVLCAFGKSLGVLRAFERSPHWTRENGVGQAKELRLFSRLGTLNGE